ncbi:tetratricopeptide repeat protein [Methylobacterium sp. ID0610]|uniref:tetratricopeptide repeat protein n=1 Tax=Methylobacterium carpenticola TaxID=3344827 RepID=UPI00369854CF
MTGRALFDAGLARHRGGALAEAALRYRHALADEPGLPEAWHMLGVAETQAGRLDPGLGLIKRALRLAPGLVEAWQNRVALLSAAGRRDEAVANARGLLRHAPDHGPTWLRLGTLLAQDGPGRAAAALAAFGHATRLMPDAPEAWRGLGLALREAEQLDAALGALRRAHALRPDAEAEMSLGNALLGRGERAGALAHLLRAVCLAPGSPECWYNLGLVRHARGETEAALLCNRRAVRLGLGLARTRLAAALADLGRAAEAEAELRAALPLPGTAVPDAVEQLTGLLLAQGRIPELRALFAPFETKPLAGRLHAGEGRTALAAADLAQGRPAAAQARLAPVAGEAGWTFTLRSVAALRLALAERGETLVRIPADPGRPRLASSTLGTRGRFAHNVLEYVLLRLYAERHGLVLETPDWVGGLFFALDDPAPAGPLAPLLFGRHLLNEGVLGEPHRPPLAGCDALSPLFLFAYPETVRERVQSWLRPRPAFAPWLDPAVARLRLLGRTLVALHLRRGDFVACGYPITDAGWYVAWLRELWPTLDRPVLYLASDDLAAVRADFAEFDPLSLADVAEPWPGLDYLQDFHVLSRADIVGVSAASGFSALAARLNPGLRLAVEPDLAARRIRPFRPWT